jgi:NAD(P)-dependent dehydrogenase (short-subunit alcohol dehydrogenase family)
VSGPVAIITGAARGIGRATAIELASRGHRLVLTSRSVDDLNETARLAGGESVVVPVDITNPSDVDRLVAKALDAFGRVDVLVNNAGYAPLLTIDKLTVEEWRRAIDTNLSSAFYTTKAVWPTFAKRRSGVIVNVSSLSSRDPFMGFSAYGAAKAGLNLFGLAIAREGAPIGVRVHTLALGAVETSMFRGIATEQQLPREKTLDPAEVARVIASCATGELQYTSGEVIYLHKTV